MNIKKSRKNNNGSFSISHILINKVNVYSKYVPFV